MDLKDKTVLVTGGSRGLGLGVMEAMVAQGAKVTVVARGAEDLGSVRNRLGAHTTTADMTDDAVARRLVGELSPVVLILNAGLYWMHAALNLPLRPSSPMSGGSGVLN